VARRARFTVRRVFGARCAVATGLRIFLTLVGCAYCARGAWATCIAPPPMIAPPHAHAQSFASAIFTDIASFPFVISVGKASFSCHPQFHRADIRAVRKQVNLVSTVYSRRQRNDCRRDAVNVSFRTVF